MDGMGNELKPMEELFREDGDQVAEAGACSLIARLCLGGFCGPLWWSWGGRGVVVKPFFLARFFFFFLGGGW